MTIDCYAFGSTVIGGSCEEAKLRLLNSSIYKSTGELIYEPVLKTEGESSSEGIYLRISPKDIDPDHFDRDFTSFLVLKDEYKTVITITIAPVMANGNHASGFN